MNTNTAGIEVTPYLLARNATPQIASGTTGKIGSMEMTPVSPLAAACNAAAGIHIAQAVIAASRTCKCVMWKMLNVLYIGSKLRLSRLTSQ